MYDRADLRPSVLMENARHFPGRGSQEARHRAEGCLKPSHALYDQTIQAGGAAEVAEIRDRYNECV